LAKDLNKKKNSLLGDWTSGGRQKTTAGPANKLGALDGLSTVGPAGCCEQREKKGHWGAQKKATRVRKGLGTPRDPKRKKAKGVGGEEVKKKFKRGLI